MKRSFEGWSKERIAMTAALDADVSFKLAYAVLFRGKHIKSLSTLRVGKWARQAGYRFGTPEQQKSLSEQTETVIAEAERRVAEIESKIQ